MSIRLRSTALYLCPKVCYTSVTDPQKRADFFGHTCQQHIKDVKMKRWIFFILILLPLLFLRQTHADGTPTGKISPWLQKRLADKTETSFFVILRQQASFQDLNAVAGHEAGTIVYNRLRVASHTQAHLQKWLAARQIPFRSYWIVNAILVKGDKALASTLARRDDVLRIEGNPQIANQLPHTGGITIADHDQLPWGLRAIGADQLWREGITGQGIVIAGNDTGIQWDHPALKQHYRGWNGNTADHNYNWWDAVNGRPVPYDDHGHGTHTLGTALGDDGADHRIGVAPGARWIGCKNMDQYGVGSPARYLSCFQFFIAPTDSQGQNPRPDLAPDLVINSWSCPPSEGCSASTLAQAIKAVQAAGIGLIVAAGNAGPSCGSVSDPPGHDGNVLSVGASNIRGELALFSGRGPVQSDGSLRNKPDVVAPGVDIYSSVPGGRYQGGWQGTSMATPHVVGLAALVLSAVPGLRRHPYALFDIIRASSKPRHDVSCPGPEHNSRYNNSWGYGFVSAPRALYFARHTRRIYDERLDNRWQDQSTAPHAMQNSDRPHTGTYSIAVHLQAAQQTLRFTHTPFTTTANTTLVFWINGGSKGGQQVAVGIETVDTTAPFTLPLTTFLPEGSLTANRWQRVAIPFSALGLTGSTIRAVDWLNTAASAQPAFYLDDIDLWESKKVVPLTLSAAYFDTTNSTLLHFNQPLEPSIARDLAHYRLRSEQDAHYRSGSYPTHVTYDTVSGNIWLSWLFPISANTLYTLTVENLLSLTDTSLPRAEQPLSVQPWSLAIDAAAAPFRPPHVAALSAGRTGDGTKGQHASSPIRDSDALTAFTFIDRTTGRLSVDVQNRSDNADYLTALQITNEHLGGVVERSRLDDATQIWQDLPSLPMHNDGVQMTFPAHSETLLTFTPYLPLENGWQLCSWPQWTEPIPASQALRPFLPALQTAYGWRNGAWQLFRPDLPAYADTLTKVRPGQALWLQLDHPATGLPLAPVTTTMTVTLQAGWNLVGYPVAQPAYLPAVLGACRDKVDALFAWRNDSWQTWQPGNDPAPMALLPGEGYWVHAEAGCQWRMGAGR